MTYLTYNVRNYFELISPLDNKKVLDFGCNHANFLLDGFSGKYVGLDIDKDVIEKNKTLYPQHNWIYYKNYNFQYKCDTSIVREWPIIDTDFDRVLAFSVFTHTDFFEFSETVAFLKKHVKQSGSLLLTFLSSKNKEVIKAVLTHREYLFGNHIDIIINKIYNSNICYVAVNLKSKQIFLYENTENLPYFDNETYFLTFYNDNWLQDNLGGEIIDINNSFKDIMGTQKCLKLSTHH